MNITSITPILQLCVGIAAKCSTFSASLIAVFSVIFIINNIIPDIAVIIVARFFHILAAASA